MYFEQAVADVCFRADAGQPAALMNGKEPGNMLIVHILLSE